MDKTVEVSQAARELRNLLAKKHDSIHPSNRDPAMPVMVKMTYGDLTGLLSVLHAATTRATQPEAALREAAEPIAGRANGYDGLPPPKYFGDTDCELRFPNSLKIEVTLGELRALRAALKDHRHG